MDASKSGKLLFTSRVVPDLTVSNPVRHDLADLATQIQSQLDSDFGRTYYGITEQYA